MQITGTLVRLLESTDVAGYSATPELLQLLTSASVLEMICQRKSRTRTRTSTSTIKGTIARKRTHRSRLDLTQFSA